MHDSRIVNVVMPADNEAKGIITVVSSLLSIPENVWACIPIG
jgi:hypothetical protein